MTDPAIHDEDTTVFEASRILALDGTEPEAFAVRDGWIVDTGPREKLGARFPSARRVQLDGRLVVPGFNDAHCHVSQAALARVRVDLSDARDGDDVLRALRARAAVCPAGEWVIGQALDESRLTGEKIGRRALDTVSGEHPVLIIHYSFHRAVANSAALDRLGYRDSSDAPAGGQLTTDEQGRLDGWLIERAWLDAWLPGTRRSPFETGDHLGGRIAALTEVDNDLHQLGITSYCDAIVGPAEHELFMAAHERGVLTPRVAMLVWYSYLRDDLSVPLEWAPHLRVSGIKMMVDGALSGGTCLCQRPYPSSTGTNNGLQIVGDDEFRECFSSAADAGHRVAVHANGDLAIAKVLDVIDGLPPAANSVRHRIEHCSITDPGLLDRIRANRVIPVPFGAFPMLFGEQLVGFYGEERADWTCAHRAMLDAGLDVAGSSDFPIVPADPLLAVQSMVTRRTPTGMPVGVRQQISVVEALQVYSTGSAHATGEADVKGTLRPGQLADFVVLGEDLTRISPGRISQVPVQSTWVGGQCVWQLTGQER
ncbi:Amidohydrolase domain protein [Nostocoides japonicum T1-X7]|uniref:Amidohydrolase domain protein n=1 Tax=Nostocoides japonicum T1-X7 TaxID=1194083 RepID=A0A077LZ42_9MICO|nr:amidohydrolase [Tetrasphaera japonica]CCH79158.1 Amidohydrolase domain protein [Tetrasphaera japonica T1-X7]